MAITHWIKWLFGLAAWASLILVVGFMTAKAQQAQCLPRAQFAAIAANSWHEFPLFEAIMESDGQTIPIGVYAGYGGTWTMVSMPTPDIVCPMSHGSGFDLPLLDSKPKGPPA